MRGAFSADVPVWDTWPTWDPYWVNWYILQDSIIISVSLRAYRICMKCNTFCIAPFRPLQYVTFARYHLYCAYPVSLLEIMRIKSDMPRLGKLKSLKLPTYGCLSRDWFKLLLFFSALLLPFCYSRELRHCEQHNK